MKVCIFIIQLANSGLPKIQGLTEDLYKSFQKAFVNTISSISGWQLQNSPLVLFLVYVKRCFIQLNMNIIILLSISNSAS